MTYGHSRVIAQIHRMGRDADVLAQSAGETNAFGNVESSYTADRTVTAFRTYPNRNTSLESTSGDRTQDNPVFLVAKGDNLPDPPEPEDHLNYDGQVYEVKAHTEYDTHVEFFGDPVIH
jgi:hypothetical protein